MLAFLRGLSLSIVITATMAYIQNGLYRITNEKGSTTFRSAVDGSTCYVTNNPIGNTDLNELWSVTAVYGGPDVYTFFNLAHLTYVTVDDSEGLMLDRQARRAFTITKLDDGSYSIRVSDDGQPGSKGWAAQSPVTHGFVKVVKHNDQDLSQKWKFDSVFK